MFLLVVGIPVVIQIIQNILFITSRGTAYPAGLELLLIIPVLIFYGWIGAVGSAFSRNSFPVQMPRKKFSLSLWVSCLVSIFLFIYFWAYPLFLDSAGDEEIIPITVIGLMVFISLSTLFYCLSFMARSIVQQERESSIHSSDFFGEFVMAVFFPVGIWLLQPRINRLNQR